VPTVERIPGKVSGARLAG